MKPQKVLENLHFVNEVSSQRQTYYVYENSLDYVVMSVSITKNNNYSFSVISKEAAIAVQNKFAGKTVNSGTVVNQLRKPAFVKSAFDALNTLYALCASGKAVIDHRFKRRALQFSVH